MLLTSVVIVIWDKIDIDSPRCFWNIKSHHRLLLSKTTRSVLAALLSCQCNDFVAVQLLNVEVIQVCVACSVVIIENTMSKKARYMAIFLSSPCCLLIAVSSFLHRLFPLSLMNNKSFVRCFPVAWLMWGWTIAVHYFSDGHQGRSRDFSRGTHNFSNPPPFPLTITFFSFDALYWWTVTTYRYL